MRYKKNIGDTGEDLAVMVLENNGYRILERNFGTKVGELDIIAMKGGVIHFVEVKTRNGSTCGYPSEAVTPAKQRHIRKAAEYYLQGCRIPWSSISLDVFEIMTDHIENCM